MSVATVSQTYGVNPPKPFTSFKMTEECFNPNLIVGIEIEVEGVPFGLDDMNVWCKPWGIQIKQDGSLRNTVGGAPWEYITKPTPTGHVLPILREFFGKMAFDQRNFSDRTSIHVHANCADMTFSQLANVSLLYTVFEEILFEFVNNRPGSRDGYSRDTNLYCVPWNQCRDHYNVVQGFLANPDSVIGRWQKYTALNLGPLARQNTIEFRHMHGTADMEKLKTWLNIIGAIFLYSERHDHAELTKQIVEMNTVSRYEEFFNECLGRSLPYNDTYRTKLEEGLIFAKYSMMTARKPSKKKAVEAPQAAPQAAPQGAGTWAPTGAVFNWDGLATEALSRETLEIIAQREERARRQVRDSAALTSAISGLAARGTRPGRRVEVRDTAAGRTFQNIAPPPAQTVNNWVEQGAAAENVMQEAQRAQQANLDRWLGQQPEEGEF